MKITRYSLWNNVPGTANYEPWIEHYEPERVICDSALVIVPGSGYRSDPDLPKQEGERVAKHYCEMGINVFCLRYRVSPDCFPIPILDGRRAIRYVRYYSEKFGINKDKVAAMGYSAGGHLTASLFTYTDKIDYEDIDDIDKECFVPNKRADKRTNNAAHSPKKMPQAIKDSSGTSPVERKLLQHIYTVATRTICSVNWLNAGRSVWRLPKK